MTDPLYHIRARVIEANPREFEGRVSAKHCPRCECMDDNWDHVPIRLADVFHLLGTLGKLSKENMHGVVFHYDLTKDDLEKQSPETVEFIGKLLRV